MNCENNFCIYCDNLKCILDDISIDSAGLCTECIYINIDDCLLKNLKESLLLDLKKTKNYWLNKKAAKIILQLFTNNI